MPRNVVWGPENRGFVVIELIIVIVLVAILTAAVVAAVNPLEQAKKAEDSDARDNASALIDGIHKFQDKNSRFPWDSTTLSWTRAGQDAIGVTKLISGGFLENMSDREIIFVGHGARDTDKLWACFIPTALSNRVDIVKLYNIIEGDELPTDGQPPECFVQPDWQNTYCYMCVAK